MEKFEIHPVWPKSSGELSQLRVTRILFCMFCIHILLNIIFLTVSQAVG